MGTSGNEYFGGNIYDKNIFVNIFDKIIFVKHKTASRGTGRNFYLDGAIPKKEFLNNVSSS